MLQTRLSQKLGQGHSPKLVHKTLLSQDATTHQNPDSNDIEYLLGTRLFKTIRQRSMLQRPQNATFYHSKMHLHTNLEFYLNENRRYALASMLVLEITSIQGQSVPKMKQDTPPSKDTFTHRI